MRVVWTAGGLWMFLRHWWQLRVMCRLGQHQMELYSVGRNYGRECWACKRPGLMSEADWDMLRYPKVENKKDGKAP